jgi:hypothetical protein
MPRSVRADLILGLALVASTPLSGQSIGAAANARPANWFDAPQTMCRSLDALGVVAGAWAPADRYSPVYICAYPPGSRPADVPAVVESARANQEQPPKNSFDVTFEVTGLHRTTADTLTLTIATLANPGQKAEAKKFLLACIRAVYQTVGRPVPSALPAYVEKEEHYLAHEPYGTVSLFTTFRYDNHSQPSEQRLWFRLGRNR